MAQVVHKVSPAVVRERIHAALEQIAAFCRTHRIRWLALFGSVLRDDFRDDSDIDVLVEFHPENPATFFDLYDMEEELSRLFGGRKIDLVTSASLYWRMRDRVLRSMVVQYGSGPEIPDAAAQEIPTPKDDRVYVGIMWEMARKIRDGVRGMTRAEYDANETLRYALADWLRRFSARSDQVSPTYRASHREISWQKTDCMYQEVSGDDVAINDETLWGLATGEIPALIPLLESLLPPVMRYPPEESSRVVHG